MRFDEERIGLDLDPAHARRLAMLGRIAGLAAHELNNQLMVVLASIEMAMDMPALAEAALEQAFAGAQRAARLADRLLALSRRDEAVSDPFDFADALRRDEPLFRMVVPTWIGLVLDVPDVPVGLRARPGQMHQVVLNLVLNAVDAIGEAKGCIRVVLRADDGGKLVLEVQDDGCGMGDETLSKLFEPFRTTKKEGLGLGLVSVKETVESLSGSVEVRSRSGEGTTVRIVLPREVVVAELPAGGVHRGRRPPARLGQGRKVLLVEDDPFVRQVVASLLGRMGYTPFSASSVAVARDLMDRIGGFWLAIVDVSLSGADDGIALMGAIRHRFPGAFVLLMSGGDRNHLLRNHAGDAPDGFLKKPFQGIELEETLRSLATLAQKRDGSAPYPKELPPSFRPGSPSP